MSYYDNDLWSRPYVTVAERRQQAAREVEKLKKKGQSVAPIRIEGRTIAQSFWGKSWCTNLERYSDYANRLPRGRSYVRNGSVVDLQIAKGQVTALVSGTNLYRIKITVAPVAKAHWQAICRDCSGSIDSLVELLQGKLSKAVMEQICRPLTGLFPAPGEIKLSCSCPDGARMCKHVAAALYGVGARLDHQPEHLFVLRGVDQNELIAGIGESFPMPAAPAGGKILDDSDVAALFGIEVGETIDIDRPAAPTPAANPDNEPSLAKTKGTQAPRARFVRKRSPKLLVAVPARKRRSRRTA